MDDMKLDIDAIFAAKEARRYRLARLPWPEKVKAIVRMQSMARPILSQRGVLSQVWELGNSGTSSR